MRTTRANLALLKAGLTQTEIARRAGLKHTTVQRATYDGPSCVIGSDVWRARLAICKATGKTMEQLWPIKEPASSSACK